MIIGKRQNNLFSIVKAFVLAGIFAFCAPCLAMTPAGTFISDNQSIFSFDVKGVRSVLAVPPLAPITVSQVYNPLSTTDQMVIGKIVSGKVDITYQITNAGNGTDVFELASKVPQGFIVKLGGATTLADTNGNGLVDTGPLAAGATVIVVMTVSFPTNFIIGNSYPISLTAYSAGHISSASTAKTNLMIVPQHIFAPITQVASVKQASPGSMITYIGNFKNAAGIPTTKAVFAANLDPNVEYVAGSATLPVGIDNVTIAYDQVTRTLTWSAPLVPTGYTGSVAYTAQVVAAAQSDVVIGNTFSGTSDFNTDPDVAAPAPVTVIDPSILRITKLSINKEVGIGEFAAYTIAVSNISTSTPLANVTVTDVFPQSFKYADGSTLVAGVPGADPVTAGGIVSWNLGILKPGAIVTLNYKALVSVGAERGNAINSASAAATTPGGRTIKSTVAMASVKIKESVLNDKAVIVGRAYEQGTGAGFKGIRLYMEDGTYVVTDGLGKFSLPGVNAGEHALKLDAMTIPRGYKVVALDTANAGDGNSRFVSVPFGGMIVADFAFAKDDSVKTAAPGQKALNSRVVCFDTSINTAALSLKDSLVKQILDMPTNFDIVFPASGAIVKKASDIAVRVPYGAEYILSVNGEPQSASSIGQTVSHKKEITVYQYVSINMKAGDNTITLSDGSGSFEQTIKVVVPGAAAKVLISPEKVEIPADGRTTVPYTVTVVDAQGHVVDEMKSITIATEKGMVMKANGEPATDKDQIKLADGCGSFVLRSTLVSGQDKITVKAGNSISGTAEVFFAPEMREWIVVGLGEATLGQNTISGNIEKVADGSIQNDIYHNERIAFFAKGQILGKYLVTAMYDSDRKNTSELFKKIDPNKYYPIYGDSSVRGVDAETSKNYFVKIEAGHSSVLAGDFQTDLKETELGAYTRTFNGLKADINEKNATFKAFATTTNHALGHDSLAGNGTSGYYFLSKQTILENSDKVVFEIRDRFHPEVVLSSVPKSSGNDYTIDYRSGTILFREPVPSVDGNLNPVTIQIYYESDDLATSNLIYGGRAAVRTDKGTEIGITGISEQKGTGDDKLYGVDTTVKLTDKAFVKAEVFNSETVEHGKGLAWKTEVSVPLGDGVITAYYRWVADSFFSPTANIEAGTTKYGSKVSYPLDKTNAVGAEGYVTKNDLSPTQNVKNVSVGVVHIGEIYFGQIGYRRIEGNTEAGLPAKEDVAFAGAGKKFGKLDVAVGREQIVSGSAAPVAGFPSKLTMKSTYQLSDKTSVFASGELMDNGTHTTTAGISHKVSADTVITTNYTAAVSPVQTNTAGVEVASKWDFLKGVNATSKTGYQIADSTTGSRTQALIGVGADYEIIKGLKVALKLERVQLVTGNYDPAGINTAVATSAEYLKEDIKATAKYEFRKSPAETTNLYSVGGAYKLTPQFSILAKSTLWTSEKATGTDYLIDAEIGGAYRPHNRYDGTALGLLRVKDDYKGSLILPTETRAIIASVEGSGRVDEHIILTGKYAGKAFKEQDAVSVSLASYTDMTLVGLTYEINPTWDVSGYVKYQTQFDTGMSDLGTIAKVDYMAAKNVRVAVGYNFSQLNDRDFGDGFGSQGVFFEVKAKFDEKTISGIYQQVMSF